MLVKRISSIATILLFCSFWLISCANSSSLAATPTSTTGKTPISTITPLSSAQATPNATRSRQVTPNVPGSAGTTPATIPGTTPDTTPTHYKVRALLAGKYRPDDLVFDPAGHLVFSDVYHGTVSRLNANGSVTVLVHGLAYPEGLVFLSNGTLIIAEQQTNRILAFTPSTSTLTVLRVLPGIPTGRPCKDGVDGIALDPTTNTLIVPD
ncbi:MAG TPA: hypothetical protein VGM01_05995, partial [Ktedonobacteraceae bacterium]